MKRFCIGLCFLMLFSTTLFAKKKPWKHTKRCVPCAPYEQPCVPSELGDYPCACALIDVGTFWIGETHDAHNDDTSDCLNPVPVFLPGSNYSYGICQTDGCTGSNCIHVSAVPKTLVEPIIPAPINYDSIPFFDSIYAECSSVSPEFFKVKIKRRGVEKEICVKIFTFKINLNKIVRDYNNNKILPKGRNPKLKWNDKLKELHVILVGFESTHPPGNVIVKECELGHHHNVREVIVKVKMGGQSNKQKAIIFLAPEKKNHIHSEE